ncbi:MAG: efflux RND transporter periplasmic adaptor subunit [Pseudomonadales bacterium]
MSQFKFRGLVIAAIISSASNICTAEKTDITSNTETSSAQQHVHKELIYDDVKTLKHKDSPSDVDHLHDEIDPANQDSKNGNESGDLAHEEGISFSPEQMALAGIRVEPITPQIFADNLYAPGEIKANGYKSYIVSPRTESVIVSRHATLGQHVEKGDELVTLFSESVAQAQANYRVAYNDWQRNKKLGKKTVSESRLLSSETDYIAAYSRLQAFGLTDAAIARVVKNYSSNPNIGVLGEYTLIAQREGAVLSDDFYQGQRVSAGEAIMVLADESELWVEARVSPNKRLNLPIGTQAVIEMADESFIATVIQEAHTIDPKTRTRIVRLAVENFDDRLHPGMFVNVNFRFETDNDVMAVPESALMLSSDGDWTVFTEDHPGKFTAVEVKLGRSLGAYREISGIAPQTRIVISGAFFVASEIAKGGFDPHGH